MIATPLAAALVAAGAAARLWSAYLAVPNRHAFGWDASRRALLNIDAGEALARLDLARLVVDLAGPETWPTLRMAFAAPLVAVFGPSLELESALTVAHYAALFLVLGLVAARLARGASAVLFATAAAALAANRALLVYAATGMLEVLSALATLAAASAWILSREPASKGRVWPVALLGNLVFHTKWQHGLFFAAAVLLVEAGSLRAEERRGALHGLAETARAAARHVAAWLFLVAALASAAIAAAVAVTGGGAFELGGVAVTVRDLHGPFFWAVFALFYGLEVELWRGRALLREAVPRRLRTLWCWLVTPMAIWLLVPFTWRLRTILVTSARYDSHAALPAGVASRIGFYPLAMWRDWYAPPARVAIVAALALAVATALRDPATRRRLVPMAALAAVELAALALASRVNFQARFALNLAPLVALAAAVPLAALPTLSRVGVAGGITAALVGGGIVPLWHGPPLAAALSEGFAAEEVATSCRPLVAALAYRDAALVNETPAGFLHDCNLAVALDARRRGARVELSADRRAAAREMVLLSACGDSPSVPAGFEPASPAERRGRLCGVVLRRR